MLFRPGDTRPDVHEFPKELSQLATESLRLYGPVIAQQCDHTGIPIQRYVTTLVECRSGEWLLRRLVTSVGKSPVGPGQVVEMKIAAGDALRWLAENQFVWEGRN
ncbi:MAG: hypothetical protein K8R36_17570 [Planctomycetales bacterium]|nr:hypothetical protein [Planctomycetales bacterium]